MSQKASSHLECVPTEAHGFLPFEPDFCNKYSPSNWAPPKLIAKSEEQARPGYNSCSANEYYDEPEVLADKIAILADLVRRSSNMAIYSGAGISTASGIGDYASKAANSAGYNQDEIPKAWSPFDAQPTLAHRVLTSMYQAGYVKHWVQQNHDGLPQKAGFPQHHLNEIHGAWYDPSNPVVKMSGNLRDDYFEWLLEWEKKTDLCLAIGTSLAGMNADRVASSAAKRAKRRVPGALGTVIISLQCTKSDSNASLRLFCKIDHAMELLAKELGVTVPEQSLFSIHLPDPGMQLEEDVFLVPHYGSDGRKLGESVSIKKDSMMILDLREDAQVTVSVGPFAGLEGHVFGKQREGHYRIRLMHPLKGSFLAPKVHILGLWWVQAALDGTVPLLPLVNCGASLKFGSLN